MREFLPIILGSDENAYACARMFYEINGERALVFCSRGLEQTSHSKILYRYVIENFDTQGVFMAVMTTALPRLKTRVKKILLIPCSDYYADLVIKNAEELGRYVDSPILSERIYSRFKDKIAFSELCLKHGIYHPKTEIVLPIQIIGGSAERTFPLVMKPANSNSHEYLCDESGARKKVYFCKSETELKLYACELLESGYTGAVVIQEYIGKAHGSSRVVNAYCDRNSKVRIIGAGEPILEYSSDKLIGNYAAIRAIDDKNLCNIAADFLEAIRYVGFANFDVRVENGQYYFLELNPRQGRSSYFIRVAGVNLMRAMYEDVVLGLSYFGRRYVSGEGLWIGEPIGVIKREMKRCGLNPTEEILLGRGALDITFDFSIPRAATLIKRKIGSYLRQI